MHMCSVTPSCLRPHGPEPCRLLCPWDFPGKNTGVGSHSLLQEIFPAQGSNWMFDALVDGFFTTAPPGKPTRYTKTKTPTSTSKELGETARYCACPLHTPPQGWADHLSHRSRLPPGPTPTLTPCKKRAHPTSESDQKNLLPVLTPPAAAGAPEKPCLNFLPGL